MELRFFVIYIFEIAWNPPFTTCESQIVVEEKNLIAYCCLKKKSNIRQKGKKQKVTLPLVDKKI
jgi:hypothetical protein